MSEQVNTNLIKYKRTYTLDYRYDSENNYWLRVRLPISMDFEIKRNNLATANTCKITLYNLSKATRDLFYRDPLDVGKPYDPKQTGFVEMTTDDQANRKDVDKLRNWIEIWAGYESTGSEYLVFSGAVLSAYSYRDNVDYKTEISAYATNLKDPQTYISYVAKAGTTQGQAIKNIALQLTGITQTNIDEDIFGKKFTEDTVLMGTAEEILQDQLGYKPYIDSGCMNICKDDCAIARDPIIIGSRSGLLTSPRRTQNGVKISMLFEPALRVGQLVQLGATMETTYNNVNLVVSGFTHRGSISPVRDSQTVSDVELFRGRAGYFRTAKTERITSEQPKVIKFKEGIQENIRANDTDKRILSSSTMMA